MLHLSLLSLPRTSPRWRRMTPYELHQQLWTAFPGLDRGTTTGRFLYRQEEDEREHSILVQSVTEPDWSGMVDEAAGSTVRVRSFDPTGIAEGTPLRFLLRANPTVDRKYPDGKTRRIAVGSDRQQIAEKLGKSLDDVKSRDQMLVDWLARKGAGGGFDIARDENDRTLCDVGPNRDIIVRKNRESETRITITSIDMTGILTVTDAERFSETVRRGIGRARSFGCGLLSIAPV